jgi:2-keto-4-pentenoate hydratase
VTPDAARQAAHCLVRAGEEGRRVRDFPPGCRPADMAAAEAIADLVAALAGGVFGGWKLGGTNPAARAKAGIERPFRGRIRASMIYESPAEIPWPDLMRPVVEPEIAFRLGRHLPPRGRDYGADDMVQAIEAIMPAIEIPESRLSDDHLAGGFGMVADQGFAGRLVLGPPCPDWQRLDLVALTASLAVNGRVVAEGKGAAAMGHPLAALAWLANERIAHGDSLRSGQVISTGSLTGIQRVAPDDKVVADFGPLGQAALTLLPW